MPELDMPNIDEPTGGKGMYDPLPEGKYNVQIIEVSKILHIALSR